MKSLLIILLLALSGCKALIKIEWYDLETDQLLSKVHYESMRTALIKIGPDGVEIITGHVTIDNETAKVLINRSADVLDPVPDFTRQPTIHRRTLVQQTRTPTVHDDKDY